MILKGSCDSKDWSNGCFAITEIIYIFKCIKIVNTYLNISVLLYFLSNKCSFVEHKIHPFKNPYICEWNSISMLFVFVIIHFNL